MEGLTLVGKIQLVKEDGVLVRVLASYQGEKDGETGCFPIMIKAADFAGDTSVENIKAVVQAKAEAWYKDFSAKPPAPVITTEEVP